MKKTNQEIKYPVCPKCNKPMRLVATGYSLRTFFCSVCKRLENIAKKPGEEI